jgi:hypothetical protein
VAGPVPTPQDFRVLTAKSGPGGTTLSWSPAYYEDATGFLPIQTYQVTGGGITKTVTGAAQMVVPFTTGAGTYQWKLSALLPDGIGGWIASAAPAVLDYTSNRYRLVALGFWAEAPSHDDILDLDGKGDEVFLAAVVNVTDRGLTTNSVTSIRTGTFGEFISNTTHSAGRIAAGTAGPRGGIRANDYIPSSLSLTGPTPASSSTNLPWIIWEGALDDNAMVVLEPVLWEYDGNAGGFDIYMGRQKWYAENNYASNDLRPIITALRDAEVLDRGPGVVSYSCVITPWLYDRNPCSGPSDRPLGIKARQPAGNHNDFFTHPLVLTQSAILKALAAPGPRNLPGGTIIYPFVDATSPTQARYELYLRVERLP